MSELRLLFVFLMSFSLVYSLPLFPGVHHMTSTFNPSEFDVLFPSKKVYLPAIQLTFDNNQTIYGLDGHLYSVPDQLIIEKASQGSCDETTTSFFHSNVLNFSLLYSSSTSFSESASSSFLGLFSSSSSKTVKKAIEYQLLASEENRQYKSVGASFCTVSTYTFDTLPPILNKPHPDFIASVNALLSPNPNYEDNIQNWLEFFEYYGFGQPVRGSLGGVVGSIWQSNLQAFQAEGKTSASIEAWASGQISGSLNWFFGSNGGNGGGSGSGGANGHASGATEFFLQNSQNISIWSGGSCSPPSCSFSSWYESVFTFPEVMSLTWTPINIYIGMVNKNASVGSINAMKNVTAISILKSIILPGLGMYSTLLSGNSNNIDSLISSANEAISSSFIGEKEMNYILLKFGEYGALYTEESLNPGWIQTSLPSSQCWTVFYGDGKFVAVSTSSDIAAYSIDGINWNQTSMPSIQPWISISYGNGLFVAIAANSDAAAYSADGINWIQITMPANEMWISIAYGGGKFVAVCSTPCNIAVYSSDGVNWNQVDMFSSQYWRSIIYGDGKFLAISFGGVSLYSDDGINWIQLSNISPIRFRSIAYGNGKFVSITNDGNNNSNNIAGYSTDGINWSWTSLSLIEYWQFVGYGDGRFVAFYMNVATYSFDGINWISISIPNGGWKSIAYGDGKFVVVSCGTDSIVWNV